MDKELAIKAGNLVFKLDDLKSFEESLNTLIDNLEADTYPEMVEAMRDIIAKEIIKTTRELEKL